MGLLSVFLSAFKIPSDGDHLSSALLKGSVPLLSFYEPSFESCGSMKTLRRVPVSSKQWETWLTSDWCCSWSERCASET